MAGGRIMRARNASAKVSPLPCLVAELLPRPGRGAAASTVSQFGAWGFVEHAKVAAEGTLHHFGRVAFLAVLLP
jgi:hypothetical protein